MSDLSTTYLGLSLSNPIVPSASPLSKTIDGIKRLEDAGAAAVVMYSLFEEQINQESHALDHFLTHSTESYAEALSYFPEPNEYNLTPDKYLEHIRKAKEVVDTAYHFDASAVGLVNSIETNLSHGQPFKDPAIIPLTIRSWPKA